MTRIIFEQHDGTTQEVEAQPGSSVMQIAVANNVPGIVAECGGSAACATCHVRVADGPVELFPAITIQEDQMLDCTAEPRAENSRLSCQLLVPAGTETFVVKVPERQF